MGEIETKMEENKEISMENYVETAYSQLESFIIIGLTGRCGSGCSTARDYLCIDFDLKTLSPPCNKKLLSDEIDFNTMKNFAKKKEKKLFPFEVIYVRNILTTFIMDNPSDFFKILQTEYPDINIQNIFDKKFEEKFDKEFEEKKEQIFCKKNFNDICIESQKIWQEIERNVYKYIDKEMEEKHYKLLTDTTRKISDFIRCFLKDDVEKDAFTLTYQHIGNLIRKYGKILVLDGNEKGKEEPKNIYRIIERINYLIKIIRRKKWICASNEVRKTIDKKSDLHLVIDSIKNVYEAYYMQARYGSFYLMGITADDKTRKERLKDKFNEEQIEFIDFREQPSMAKKYIEKHKNKEKDATGQMKEIIEEVLEKREKKEIEKKYKQYNTFLANSYIDGTCDFCLQDVECCIQNADILINNSGTTEELRRALLRYVCLMHHPGLVLPTIDERNMQIAQAAKINSGCISRQVGAVISDKHGNILSIGWNDPAAHEGNECFSCVRRNLTDLMDPHFERAYSYFELTNPTFRKHLANKLFSYLSPKFKKEAGKEEEESRSPEELQNLYKLFEKDNKEDKDNKDNKDSLLKSGLPISYCFKDLYQAITREKNQVHTRAQHGEEKALEGCNKSQTAGGTMYSTSSSCELCAKKALSYNIARIVYIEPYSGITNDHILGHEVKEGTEILRFNDNGYEVKRHEQMRVELFTGATKRAYSQLYSPIFPLKDELKLRGINLKEGNKKKGGV